MPGGTTMPETTTANQPTTDTQPTTRLLCRHIRTSGRRCRMIALRHQHFCFYHHAARRPIPGHAARYPDADRHPFAVPVLEDRPAIQLALSQVFGRIAANDLDPKRAGLLLYCLQIAVTALPRETRKPIQPKDYEHHEEHDDHDTQESQNTHDLSDSHETDPPEAAETTAEMLDNLEQDPTYGPLAPVTPFTEPQPEARGLDPFERYLRDTNTALCPQCQTLHPRHKPTPQPDPTLAPQPHQPDSNPNPDPQPHPEILRILQATPTRRAPVPLR